MIHVKNLSKYYGQFAAVDNLSFDIPEGSITGFLGPNGAGKSTTMRLLTTFVPPTSGQATVAGFDIASQAAQVRAMTGYLPENAPLYDEMTPQRFLGFRAKLYGLSGAQQKNRLGAVKEQCTLADVWQTPIGNLSKGYRQRVALADAILHEPKVMFLDEPTVGLDPHQVVGIRALIQSLRAGRTIVLSSHILSEVELLCDNVIIIYEGKLVAIDTPANLIREGQATQAIDCDCSGNILDLERVFKQMPHVSRVQKQELSEGQTRLSVFPAGQTDVRDDIFSAMVEQGVKVTAFSQRRLTLENIFLMKTGQAPIEKGEAGASHV